MQRSVRVAGIGIVSPFGTSHDAFRDALLEGRSGILPVIGFDVSQCRTQLAAQVADFQPTDWVPAMKLRRLDRTGVYAVAVAKLALRHAATTPAADGDDRAGVVLGTATAGGQSTQVYLDAFFRGGPTSAPALLFDSTVGNSAASLAGLEFKLRGPNATVSHKEASGAAAIATAVDLLRAGRTDALLAGGVDGLYETFFKAHDVFGVMSPDKAFSNRLAPFDRDRSGFVLGEGAYGFWLDAVDAEGRRGSCGEILGIGAASAAVPLNAWPDRIEPLVRTMRLALDDAALTADDVDVIYSSANATRELDATEGRALAAMFSGRRAIVTSLKGALGEFGASGAAACAAALLCGASGKVPPIAGIAQPDEALAGLSVATTVVPAPGPIALVNSFASGGALFSLVLRTRPPV